MARYIDADKLIEELKEHQTLKSPSLSKTTNEAIDLGLSLAMRIARKAPTADVVSMEAYKQVAWERDTAIEQLKSYGVGFCEDKELAEVKHGEWKPTNIPAYFGGVIYECSLCGAKDGDHTKVLGRYCWRCGAKMDGGNAE